MNRTLKYELLQFMSNDKDEYESSNISDFMDIIYQNDLYEYTQDIYDDDLVNDIVAHELKENRWQSVKYMLAGIQDTSKDYYYLDGYGHFRNVTNKDIDYIIDDIIDNYEFSKEEDYEL